MVLGRVIVAIILVVGAAAALMTFLRIRDLGAGLLMSAEFAGAARELDSALLVNPHDREAVADALGRAMDMPIEERRERWRQALDRIRAGDVHGWSRGFLGALERCRRG
ncbi:MAG: trehalose-6-phosphate synthase [Pseudomonadota bacterium]|jgi:trehalose-6-phosphate synthase